MYAPRPNKSLARLTRARSSLNTPGWVKNPFSAKETNQVRELRISKRDTGRVPHRGRQTAKNKQRVFFCNLRDARKREREREGGEPRGKMHTRVRTYTTLARMQRIAFCNGKCCVCSYRDCESRSSCLHQPAIVPAEKLIEL